jgi:hypothetical protein
MKLIDISSNCYAHLIDNRVFLYIDNEFVELLHVDGIENSEDPIPLILAEYKLASRPSLFKWTEFL